VDLAEAAGPLKGQLMPWSADYRDEESLAVTVASAVSAFGPVDTVVAWIHSDAETAPLVVARGISAAGEPFRYFDLVGSGEAELVARADGRRERLLAVDGLSYRRVVLGGKVEDGAFRWLTREEIARGVLDAVEGDADETVVGTIRDA
jgi:hypothetical protein